MRLPILFRAVLISLTALGAGACEHLRSTAPPPAAAAGISIPVRDYPAERQQRLADEISAAPADAVWPEMIADYSTLRRSACATTPAQPACRRICVAERNSPSFCQRANAE